MRDAACVTGHTRRRQEPGGSQETCVGQKRGSFQANGRAQSSPPAGTICPVLHRRPGHKITTVLSDLIIDKWVKSDLVLEGKGDTRQPPGPTFLQTAACPERATVSNKDLVKHSERCNPFFLWGWLFFFFANPAET